jgi:hypothetical protein
MAELLKSTKANETSRMMTSNAKEKIEEFNSIGLHYNIVADAVYKKRTDLDSPFNPEYLPYIVAALISFEMERMMGPDRASRYDTEVGGFATLLSQKLAKIQPLIAHLIRANLTSLDIEKERQSITAAYEVLAKAGKDDGLNRRKSDFHVGATKILHFLNPDAFLIIDSNAARAFRSFHNMTFRNAAPQGYSSSKYISCMKCAQKDILDCGVGHFRALEPNTPIGRIYDKLTFITGSQQTSIQL